MPLPLTRRSILGGMAMLASPLLAQTVARTHSSLTIQRLAWAGVRVTTSGVDLFIDATAWPPTSPPVPELLATGSRAFALATHHHPDHCDLAALARLLGTRGYLTVHEDTARLLSARDVSIQAVRMHEPVLLSRGGGEFVARCVAAADGLGSPQVSWVVDGGGRRLIHCGDTAWHGGWWDVARAYGPFDIAFLPINGFRQTSGRFRNADQPMSLTPEQAARAASILGTRLAIPIHFGATPGDAYVEEADALRRFETEAVRLGVPVRRIAPGASVDL